MSPEVTAAIIAASVGVITVIATVAVQISGRRATSRDTQKALDVQRDQLNTTLAAQREQLDRTLAEQRTRTLNERFSAAAAQLGDDKPPAVRLAGAYAMAGLADDWLENRQTCVDVLCGYLRMPYEPDPGDEAPGPERLAFRADREVRHTVIRVITVHLKDDAPVSWQGLNFDFTGVVFDGGDFSGARFSGGLVRFDGAGFSGGQVSFGRSEFSGGIVSFRAARFSGGEVSFDHAKFSGGRASFSFAEFSGGKVSFGGARFSGSLVSFRSVRFSGGRASFALAEFSGGTVDFGGAGFPSGMVDFSAARFSGGLVRFMEAKFAGGMVSFDGAGFIGGTVDFSSAGEWSLPPVFPWTDTPPPGVKLPRKDGQSQA
jgi:uncharacterized protein YjbI with pentapeptide repeats